MLSKEQIWDERRTLAVPGDEKATLTYSAEHWIFLAKKAIEQKGSFFAALSGGSTPKAIYTLLATTYSSQIDWTKVHLFWSDERCVPPTDPENNYYMAMEAGIKALSIPASHIHRMHAEKDIEKHATLYEAEIRKTLGSSSFDLIMLGMGEDGHTASLFPSTEALKVADKLIVANTVPSKKCTRMTMTFPCINSAQNIVIYVIGAAKASMLKRALSKGEELPVQRVGTKKHKALWIADESAASSLDPFQN